MGAGKQQQEWAQATTEVCLDMRGRGSEIEVELSIERIKSVECVEYLSYPIGSSATCLPQGDLVFSLHTNYPHVLCTDH